MLLQITEDSWENINNVQSIEFTPNNQHFGARVLLFSANGEWFKISHTDAKLLKLRLHKLSAV